MFGHSISMNFDNKHPTHNTGIGGLFTLLTYAIIIAMVAIKTQRIITYGNPDLNSITELSPEGLKEDHDYTDMNAFNFHSIKK